MNLRDILADIHALEEDLLTFERQYGIRILYHRLPAVIDWYGYEIWQRDEKLYGSTRNRTRTIQV